MMISAQFSMSGKVVLVTGASSGIGRHLSKVLAAAGASVVAVARRTDRLESLVAEIESAGGKATAIAFDVAQREGVGALFDEAERAIGLVDVLINSAGIAKVSLSLELDEADWDRVMEVNVNGLRRLSQEAARRLATAGKPGSIVNIASVAGMGASPGYSAYSTSKAAVIQLTRSMAVDLWRHDIRVNAICPGYFLTEINEDYFATERGQAHIKRLPPRRLGELEELSGPCLLLASDASSFMTGVALPVDGGHSVQLV
jgi:NAD(P)-dependent dehydrogenase (short-subunit alcohol dehydrogenase family)